jgi:4-carboxymuconolactone decarboxylase
VCVLAAAREFDNAFEWATHEPEALRVGVHPETIQAIKLRRPSAEMPEPFGTVVELIRGAFTTGSVSARNV